MPIQPEILPLDIIENVIEVLATTQARSALCNCARVSRSFSWLAIKYIYRTAVLQQQRMGTVERSGERNMCIINRNLSDIFCKFYETTQANPHLVSLIRHLRVEVNMQHLVFSEKGTLWGIFRSICNFGENLESFLISSHLRPFWRLSREMLEDKSTQATRALMDVLRLPTVHTLRLEGLYMMPILDFLSYFPNITHFQFKGIYTEDRDFEECQRSWTRSGRERGPRLPSINTVTASLPRWADFNTARLVLWAASDSLTTLVMSVHVHCNLLLRQLNRRPFQGLPGGRGIRVNRSSYCFGAPSPIEEDSVTNVDRLLYPIP